MATTARVAHVLASSEGGIRRHVRYLAQHPPDGYSCAGVWGPARLAAYFTGIPYFATTRLSWLRPPVCDVVHAHGFVAGAVAWARRRSPVVLTVHTDLHTQGRTAQSVVMRTIAKATVRRADGLIAPSAAAARYFPGAWVIAPASERLGPPRRSREQVREELGTPEDQTVVITVARLHRDKSPMTFVDAVRQAGAEGWMCGDGPMRRELRERTEGTSIRVLGYREDVADLLGAADVFALPSAGESYGIAVLEAVAAGLPVVCSRAGAMPEIAGEAGLFVEPGDEEGFRGEVRRAVEDADVRAELARCARKVELPDPEELARAVGRVYDEVRTR